VRRFPIQEYFLEDLPSLLALPPKERRQVDLIFDECEKKKCQAAPPPHIMEKIYKLATIITSSVGSTGSSVLIFVPGMADIEALTELIDGLRVPNVSFICLPIHSDIPFEEQMLAFNPPQQGEVKVIIATNAAESSLTLPDVDHVICLG
jgi:HrpA-like RNA helicase